MRYFAPIELQDAIRLRQETGFPILAGGTDLYPSMENGAAIDGVIDITRIEALRGPIRYDTDALVIPALTTWSELIGAELPPQFTCVKQAAAEVGGRQIQNAGTVGGNICNASPAADGVTALLALDSSVVLEGMRGERCMPLAAFIHGNRRIALSRDEVVTAVRVPILSGRHASTFKKLGARRYLVISIVMAAVLIEFDEHARVRKVGVAIGACADRVLRLPAVEQSLLGLDAAAVARFELPDAAFAPITPIDDIRGTAVYRRHAAKALVKEALYDISHRLSG